VEGAVQLASKRNLGPILATEEKEKAADCNIADAFPDDNKAGIVSRRFLNPKMHLIWNYKKNNNIFKHVEHIRGLQENILNDKHDLK
jgi:DNA modification methylase